MGTNSGKEKQKKMQCEVTGIGRPLVLVPGGLTGWASWEHGDITELSINYIQNRENAENPCELLKK